MSRSHTQHRYCVEMVDVLLIALKTQSKPSSGFELHYRRIRSDIGSSNNERSNKPTTSTVIKINSQLTLALPSEPNHNARVGLRHVRFTTSRSNLATNSRTRTRPRRVVSRQTSSPKEAVISFCGMLLVVRRPRSMIVCIGKGQPERQDSPAARGRCGLPLRRKRPKDGLVPISDYPVDSCYRHRSCSLACGFYWWRRRPPLDASTSQDRSLGRRLLSKTDGESCRRLRHMGNFVQVQASDFEIR